MSLYRVGIIGCGSIAHAHAKAYKALGLDIVAAADIKKERLMEFGRLYGIKRLYEDYRVMLQKERLDIISICTWPTLHCEMTVYAAEANVRGILCEKPMATSLKEADVMISACRRAGVKLAIGHMRRFMKLYSKARDILSSNAIGEPIFIHGMTVGDLLSDGSHLIDLIFFFMNDQKVRWVIGQIDIHERRRRYGHYVEDAAIGYFEFEDGIRAFIEVSQMTGSQVPIGKFGFTEESIFQDLERVKKINWWRRGVKYCSIRIVGTDGRIEVGEWEEEKLKLRGKGNSEWQVIRVEEVNPFVEEIRDLIRSIEEDREPLCSGEKARQTIEIIMAIYESARRKEIVILPLEIDYNPLSLIIRGE